MPYGQSAPVLNPNTFPYRRKWTKAETDELEQRITKLRDAMVDMVGMSGVLMHIDAGSIANIATHLALAGADVHDDERQYIWRDASPDELNIFEQVKWHIKQDVPIPPERPTLAEQDRVRLQAEQAQRDIYEQLDPEVRKLLIRNLAHEFKQDTSEPEDGEQ